MASTQYDIRRLERGARDGGAAFLEDVSSPPDELWRWLGSDEPPDDPPLRHGESAFLEEPDHDWRYVESDGGLRYYYSRLPLRETVWVILVYDSGGEEPATDECGSCDETIPSQAEWCPYCGADQS